MLRILFSLMYVTCIFFLFYRSVGFEENIKYTKKFITPAMEFADIAAFTLARENDRASFASFFFARSYSH